MNKKFVLSLLSTPALFMSMLSMVMMTKPAHASQTVTPVGSHLSCIRSPHSAIAKQVCIQVSNTPASLTNSQMTVAQVQSPNQPAELEFTDAQSDEAINCLVVIAQSALTLYVSCTVWLQCLSR